jgi:hypothetical protein
MKNERHDETQFITKIDGFQSMNKLRYEQQGQNWQIQNQCISDRGGRYVTSSLQGVSIVNPRDFCNRFWQLFITWKKKKQSQGISITMLKLSSTMKFGSFSSFYLFYIVSRAILS